MQTQTFMEYALPGYHPREDPYVESIRMDLSRVNRSLERATHPFHRSTLEKAREFLQRLFEKAAKRG